MKLEFTDDEKFKVKYIQQRYDILNEEAKKHEDVSHKMRMEQKKLFQEFCDIMK